MSGEISNAGGGNGRYARIGAILPAMVAMAGALWVALEGDDCMQCSAAGELLMEAPLAWIGTAYYALLTLLAWKGGFSMWTRFGFIAACGVHAVLLGLLAKERLFCGGCVTAGLSAMAGGIGSLLAKPRIGRWALIVFTSTCLTSLGCVMKAQQWREDRVRKELSQETRPTTMEGGRVTLVIYERPGCKHCLDFEERVLPPVMEAVKEFTDVSRLDALPAMTAPTIQVIGKSGERLFEGGADQEELVRAIRELR